MRATMSFSELVFAALAAGGGGAVLALALIRAFGEKWLDSKFAGRLQDPRHEHEHTMERARLTSSQNLDRATRLAEREFDNTAEAWSLVTDAYVKTLRALPGYRQFEDFSQLSDDLAKLVARQHDFAEWEIEELIAEPKDKRLQYFIERNTIHEIGNAKRAISEASSHLTRNALFIDVKIQDQFSDFLEWGWKAIVAWDIVLEIRRSGGSIDEMNAIERDDEDFRSHAPDKIEELKSVVRGRFWPPQEG